MAKTLLNYNWINGEQVTTATTLEVFNPANQQVIGTIPSAGQTEVKNAVASAANAFQHWACLTAEERADYLEKWAANLLEHKQELARIMSEEQGKPMYEAEGEIAGCSKFIQWYAQEGKRIYGETIPPSSTNQRITVLKQPVGVCGLITPWNFPGAMVARKVAPALAAGCTVVVKPSSETPRIAIALFDELMATGIPNGVANLLTGKASVISEVLFADERVRKISFTGSTDIGKVLMKQAADQVKRISLELGGNAPVIVFPDADLDQAAAAIVDNKFENCGQMCNGINIILVHESIRQGLTEKIVARVKQLNVGCGTEDNVQVGPLINQAALDNVERLVVDAVEKGADILTGGEKITSHNGLFYAPTVLSDVTEKMDLVNEEIFGPVAPILSFEQEAEVIELANRSPYGLAAYFFTNDVNRVHRVSETLEFGMVGVNGTQLSVPQAPFGGIKESGMGREGGHYGLDGFLELKYISLSLNQ